MPRAVLCGQRGARIVNVEVLEDDDDDDEWSEAEGERTCICMCVRSRFRDHGGTLGLDSDSGKK